MASRDEGQEWLRRAAARALKRAREAVFPADRGALLREALRLAGATILDAERYRLATVDFERFGIVPSSMGERNWSLTLRRDLGGMIPAELRKDLEAALLPDPQARRPDDPAVGDAVLLRLTSFQSYRNPSQKSAIRAALTMPGGATLLATLATGTGKSLLFQLDMLAARERARGGLLPLAVVLVPTVALALDHEHSANAFEGLKGSRALTGDVLPTERGEILAAFGRGEIPLLFISPEMALGAVEDSLILAARSPNDPNRPMAARGLLDAIYVDEAHIVATWGKSFRPDLQKIPALVRNLRRFNPSLRTVLLSATVDDATLELLESQYAELGRPDLWLRVTERVPRCEFDFVEHKFTSVESRDNGVLGIVDILPRPALIYTTEIEKAEKLYRRLRDERGYSRVRLFTGETTPEDRRAAVKEWRDGRVDLVVATSAFGMGIDHSEVRAVVHACLPEGAARFYQEIGRGGRDGHQALSTLLWCQEDEGPAISLASGKTLTLEVAQSRWQGMLRRCRQSFTSDQDARYVMDLSARPIHVTDLFTGAKNLLWNKSLLVQLQRFGGLRIEAGEEGSLEWRVRSHQEWLDLWAGSTADAALARLFAARECEVNQAREAVRQFIDIWRRGDVCVLHAVFESVEAGRPFVGSCGRCPYCRLNQFTPQLKVQHCGGEAAWTSISRPARHGRLLLVGAERAGDIGALLTRLRREGVTQIVASASLAASVAREWAKVEGELGWVIEWERVLNSAHPFKPLNLPTALVLTSGMGTAIDDAFEWGENWRMAGGPLAWWVAAPNTYVQDGRALEDLATIYPPVAL